MHQEGLSRYSNATATINSVDSPVILTIGDTLVTRYYAAADLFLFPSMYDNAPLVVREAAALHTPAVMVEGSTAATILRDGENGYLVPNDLEAFAARLRDLYRDKAAVRRAGLAASRTIVRSWEDVVGEVLDRYDALIARKTRIRPLK